MSLTQEQLKEQVRYIPETGEFIRLTSRGVSKANSIVNVRAKKEGYIEFRVWNGLESRKYKAHRLAWLYMTGEFPLLEIDHIDGNRANNKFDNLREVSRSINQRNRELQSNSPSGVLGVTWNKQLFKWQVHFKSKYVKQFDSFWDAVALRKKLEVEDGTFEENHSSIERIEFV